MYEYMISRKWENLSDTVINYLSRKITYGQLDREIEAEKVLKALEERENTGYCCGTEQIYAVQSDFFAPKGRPKKK